MARQLWTPSWCASLAVPCLTPPLACCHAQVASHSGASSLLTRRHQCVASSLKRLQVAIQTVEQLRLTLDSRRRTVSALEGDITNMQAKTTNPQDPKLMKFVERKHRQEVKMLRAHSRLRPTAPALRHTIARRLHRQPLKCYLSVRPATLSHACSAEPSQSQHCARACAEVHDDFHSKEVTTYQNMRHLVNDVKYVQQHILKLFDLLRQISGDVCDAFPPGGPVVAEARTTYITNGSEAAYGSGAGSEAHYSDNIAAAHGGDMSDALDDGSNQARTPLQ